MYLVITIATKTRENNRNEIKKALDNHIGIIDYKTPDFERSLNVMLKGKDCFM